MNKMFFISVVTLFSLSACGNKENKNMADRQENQPKEYMEEYIKADVYETSDGQLKITLAGHGSLIFQYNGKIIHIDPYSKVADYARLPKADLILITHEHGDHLDTAAINTIWKDSTFLLTTNTVNNILGYGNILKNGDKTTWNDISILAVPAYNIINKRPDGEAYHPKGRGNGYVISFGDKKVYAAGDTENISEMNELKGTIDIAFLPKNLPYTMSDDMFMDAAEKIMPKVLYPYHMSEFDKDNIGEILENTGIKIEVRPMKNL